MTVVTITVSYGPAFSAARSSGWTGR